MPVERAEITRGAALKLLGRVHNHRPPNRDLVVNYVREMAAADERGEPWKLTATRSVVVAESSGAVMAGVEVLLALAYLGRRREVLLDQAADPGRYARAVAAPVGPATAGNGTTLTTEMTIVTWVEDPGPADE